MLQTHAVHIIFTFVVLTEKDINCKLFTIFGCFCTLDNL